MLKQPDRIVIYPQRDSSPDYLLCWIPPRSFRDVSGGSREIEAELEEFYPTGFETEFSQDGFDEFGISLAYDLDELRGTFLSLSAAGIFAEVDYIDIERLQEFVDNKNDETISGLIEKFSNEEITLDDLKSNPILRRLLEKPRTIGNEEPGESFQKLSGQLDNSD